MSQDFTPQGLPPARIPESGASEEEKASYSLDEMMKALREKEREKDEKGEVVTRADGSLARKVKRRKRRSEQAKEPEPEKSKRGLLIKVTSFVFLVLALVVGGVFLLVWQNSRGYREGIEKEAGEWTGAEVELKQFRRSPFGTTASEILMKWPAPSYVRELGVRNLDGEVSFLTFFGSRPKGIHFGGQVGWLDLQMPTATGEVGLSLSEEDFPFQFDQYFCRSLDIRFGEKSSVGFAKAYTTFRSLGAQGYELAMSEGRFRLKGWDDFAISNGVFRFHEGKMDVVSLSLMSPKPGQADSLARVIKLNGEVVLKAGENAVLAVESGRYDLDALVGKNLGKFVQGSVLSSSGEVKFRVGEKELDELVLNLAGDEMTLVNLPFLNTLRELFPDRDLEVISFGKGITETAVRGVLRVRPEGMALEKLRMASGSNFQLQGAIVIGANGRLGGEFELAINRVFTGEHPSFRNNPSVVEDLQTGFSRVRFKLGGTVSRPEDNLRSLMGQTSSLRRDDPQRSQEGMLDELWRQLTMPE